VLKSSLVSNSSRNINYDLRNKSQLRESHSLNNKFGNLTFTYFFPRFVNHFCLSRLQFTLSNFKLSIINNSNFPISKLFIKL
jgi:hypothetical protein